MNMFLNTISAREQEVLYLIAFEHTCDEIAQRLYISPNTVKSHKKNLQDKLDVRNIAGMVRRGVELGILNLNTEAESYNRIRLPFHK